MKKKAPIPKKLTHIYDEQLKQYLPVIDKITELNRLSRRSSAISFKNKRKEKIGLLKKEKKSPPVPGGIGYGVYYNQAFQWNFSNFSGLDMGLLVPKSAGGNSTNYLYLTATNGTAKGVEALVSYYGQEEPQFKIYDWAVPDNDKFVRTYTLSSLTAYLSTVKVNGNDYRLIRILNRTERVSPGVWENKVCLFNYTSTTWDKIYEYQYDIDDQKQKDQYQGSWGPLVETFQNNYTDLNSMGFYKALLYNDANSPKLTAGNTMIRNDDDGVDIQFIDKNWIFYVS
jgi:hypothetical protein